MKYSKIALIGMMGCGKSTISKKLAQKLNRELLDTDVIFEQTQKIKIKDFFEKYGEEKFREIETQILIEALKKENVIISCGGGIVLKKENQLALFNDKVFTIYLEANPQTIYDRIKHEKTRPLLLVKDPKKEIETILKTRENLYNKANLKINTNNKTPDEIIEEIWKK